jgi:hypothetical protein
MAHLLQLSKCAMGLPPFSLRTDVGAVLTLARYAPILFQTILSGQKLQGPFIDVRTTYIVLLISCVLASSQIQCLHLNIVDALLCVHAPVAPLLLATLHYCYLGWFACHIEWLAYIHIIM